MHEPTSTTILQYYLQASGFVLWISLLVFFCNSDMVFISFTWFYFPYLNERIYNFNRYLVLIEMNQWNINESETETFSHFAKNFLIFLFYFNIVKCAILKLIDLNEWNKSSRCSV